MKLECDKRLEWVFFVVVVVVVIVVVVVVVVRIILSKTSFRTQKLKEKPENIM